MNPLEKMVVERLERRADKIRQDFIRDQLIGWQEAYSRELEQEDTGNKEEELLNKAEATNAIRVSKIVIAAVKINKTKTRLKKKPVTHDQHVSTKFQAYITRSEKKGFPFQLTKSDFQALLEDCCCYCGKCPGGTVDRIDSKAGYTTSNSQPACFRCNVMKYTFSDQEFRNHINKIYNKLKKRHSIKRTNSGANYTLW